MEKFESIIAEINRKYELQKQTILHEATECLIHWPSPTHGYREREEFESDPRYRELVNTQHIIRNGLVRPESDIRVENGRLEVTSAWFYSRYFSKEMAMLKALFPEWDSSAH